MNIGSVCSGIEAATVAWEPLGMRFSWYAEVDKFCCALLEHYYDTPNLGDITKITEADLGQYPPIDILVGGTPCQDLSVAGKRAGLAGSRSGLFWDMIRVAEQTKPKWIVFENVPGLLSSNNGKDIQTVLDAFTQIGYVCDIDVLDAQYFGVAQRRRRVFITCVRLDDLLRKKTSISERIIAELLAQALQSTWDATRQVSYLGRSPSEYARRIEQSVAFLSERMTLLESLLGESAVTKLLAHLAVAQPPYTGEPQNLGSTLPRANAKQTADLRMDTGGSPPKWMDGESGDKSIGLLWSGILKDLYQAANTSTTSTLTSKITESRTCIFARAVVGTLQSTIDSEASLLKGPWSDDYWNLASLFLTLLKDITDYARQASEQLFGTASERDDWRHCLCEARATASVVKQRLGDTDSSKSLFSLPESLCRNPPPSREAGAEVARPIAHGATPDHYDESQQTYVTGPLQAHSKEHGHAMTTQQAVEAGQLIAGTLNSGGNDGGFRTEPGEHLVFDTTQVTSPGNYSAPKPGDACHPLAKGQHPPAIAYRTSGNCGVMEQGDKTAALNCNTDPTQNIVAYQCHGSNVGEMGTLRVGNGNETGGVPFVEQSMAVRRLTVEECEKLQGFSPGYTKIPYRNKPADKCPDGPRYRALGNSMAVPCMAWLGTRIQQVEETG